MLIRYESYNLGNTAYKFIQQHNIAHRNEESIVTDNPAQPHVQFLVNGQI